MKKQKEPKYSFVSAATSFVIPVVWVLSSLLTSDFRRADGSPDNAPIRMIPPFALLFGFVFLIQLGAYYALGKKQYSLKSPLLKVSALYATALSLPLPLLAYYFSAITEGKAQSSTLLDILVSICIFTFLWGCFFAGAFVQYKLIQRHKKLQV